MRRARAVILAVVTVLVSAAAVFKFVKVRMTGPKTTMSRSDATNFVRAWIELLR